MFIRNDTELFCSLADYTRDFGKMAGTRYVQTDEGAYLWHATLKSQAMIGTRLLAIKRPHGTQYIFNDTPELFSGKLGGAGFSLQDGLEYSHKHFSSLSQRLGQAALPPHYEGATTLVSYRQMDFDTLLAHVTHCMYRMLQSEVEVSAARALRQVNQAFQPVPELYDENLLRDGMDKHENRLGFTASHHIVVGATDKHSFNNVLLRAIKVLAPEQIFALETEVQE